MLVTVFAIGDAEEGFGLPSDLWKLVRFVADTEDKVITAAVDKTLARLV